MHHDIDDLTWGKLPELFRRDVDRTGECWLWIGPTFLPKESIKPHANYGNQSIYFFVYRLVHGVPMKGMQIHHQCHQPLCVRPSHLELLTKFDHLARHNQGPLREQCANGHSTKEFGDHIFPSGRKICNECLRLNCARRLAQLNALPHTEKLRRNRMSNAYKRKRSARDPIYAAQQKAYRDAYNKRYWDEKREELAQIRREQYKTLPSDIKQERSRKNAAREKRRMENDPAYAKEVARKKLAYQRRYIAEHKDRIMAQRHAAYVRRKMTQAQPPG